VLLPRLSWATALQTGAEGLKLKPVSARAQGSRRIKEVRFHFAVQKGISE
jgi:hypothetical protein